MPIHDVRVDIHDKCHVARRGRLLEMERTTVTLLDTPQPKFILVRTKMAHTIHCIAVLAVICFVAVLATPLDDYVNKPDPTYKWESVNSIRSANFTTYNIKLTSQTWMHTSQVSISVWTHWLQICIPDNVRHISRTELRCVEPLH